MRSRGRALVLPLLLHILVLPGTAMLAASAEAQTITGTVGFSPGGVLPSSVGVTVYQSATGTQIHFDRTYEFQGWQYTISNLPPGEYKVRFTPSGGHYLQEWWLDAASQGTATAVPVTEGVTATANPTLDLGGVIAGTIGFAPGGIKPSSVRVSAFRDDTGGYVGERYTYESQLWQYSIGNLPPGDYKLHLETWGGEYLSEWWLDAVSQSTAASVVVTAGGTAAANPTLDLGGVIAGTVGFVEGGIAPDSISVVVYRADTGASVGSDSTDGSQNWQYSIARLTTGEYKVRFTPSGGHYLEEWWLDATSQGTATAVPVTEGVTTTANPTLDLGGVIAGTVGFVEGGIAPDSISVVVYRADTGASVGSDSTDGSQNWQYSIARLTTGEYKIRFTPSGGHYLEEWWLDATSQRTATAVPVTEGVTTTASLMLDLGGMIAGTIGFSAGGIKPSSVQVYTYRADNGVFVGSDYANESRLWQYSIGNLPPGEYKIRFEVWNGDYLSEWWQDADAENTATPVGLIAGASASASPTLDLGGIVQGTVGFAEGGMTPSSVGVEIYRSGTDALTYYSTAHASQGWAYRINGILPGEYTVLFKTTGGNYASEWWKDNATHETATLIVVQLGAAISLNPTLDIGGFVSGRVGFVGFGAIPSQVAVNVYPVGSNSAIDSAVTTVAKSWSYSSNPLLAGDYLLEFKPLGGTCHTQWWLDQDGKDSATPSAVVSGQVTAVNPSLSLGARLSGTIRFGEDGVAPERAEVTLYRADTGSLAGLTATVAEGGWQYSVIGLRAGEYKVEFQPLGGSYSGEWFNGRGSLGTAEALNIEAEGDVEASPVLYLRRDAILWRDRVRQQLGMWTMDGLERTNTENVEPTREPRGWNIVGTGDFNGDREMDILLKRNSDGLVRVWFMNGPKRISGSILAPSSMPAYWAIAGTADFNLDGKTDLLWRNRLNGSLRVWLMEGVKRISSETLTPSSMPLRWSVAGLGDFNSDGKTDILWRNAKTGSLRVWYMDGTIRIQGVATTPSRAAQEWSVAATGDFNYDEKVDILWRNSSNGSLVVWLMRGVSRSRTVRTVPESMPRAWEVLGYGTNSIVRQPRPTRCESCHDGTANQAPNMIQGKLGESALWDGSWWQNTQGGVGRKQQGGHGDPDGKPAVECTKCHDVSAPLDSVTGQTTHLDGTYNSIWNNTTRNTNTSHLKAEFFTKYPAVGAGDWSVQVAFDNYCTWECHDPNRNNVQDAGEPTRFMRHQDQLNDPPTANNHDAIQFGRSMTPPASYPNPDLIPDIPIDVDLDTDASPTGNYAPCVSCHDPHGTGTPVPPTDYLTNLMLRFRFPPDNAVLCSKCHR